MWYARLSTPYPKKIWLEERQQLKVRSLPMPHLERRYVTWVGRFCRTVECVIIPLTASVHSDSFARKIMSGKILGACIRAESSTVSMMAKPCPVTPLNCGLSRVVNSCLYTQRCKSTSFKLSSSIRPQTLDTRNRTIVITHLRTKMGKLLSGF